MSRVIAALVVCLLAILTSATFAQEGTSSESVRTYTIQPGDTLFSIARRYNTSVNVLAQANGIVNPANILWGQQIQIPGEQASAAPVSSTDSPSQPPPPSASSPTIYVVKRGDILNRIALQYNLTVAELLAANPDIRNANLLYTDQRINIPGQTAADDTPLLDTQPAGEIAENDTSGESSETTGDDAPNEVIETLPIAVAEFGLEANLLDQISTSIANDINTLGVTWVKQVVNWREIEPVAGEIDFDALDQLIDSLQAQNKQIMLTVTAAPDWARSIQEENGPPDNFEDFAAFVGTLANRYAGQVTAYQIWNEPNLRSRWKSTVHPISAASYVDLLRQAHDAIRAADPDALIISAGLAPTGFNDALNAAVGNLEINAVDDRVFLSGIYAEGGVSLVDAVGAHPIGWANPPDALCCEQAEGVQTHFEDPHFYFLNTLQEYRQIQLANGDTTTPLWVTKFGWGTSEDIGATDPINVFTAYTTLAEQAQYTTRAFNIGNDLGYVGPMFAFNLNGCQAPGDDGPSSCYYSLLGPDGTPRPVFEAIQNLDKTVVEEIEPEDVNETNSAQEIVTEPVETTPEVSP
jgi:LysM repeat protein